MMARMYQKAGPSESIICDRFGGHWLQLNLLLAADGKPRLDAEYAEWGGIDFGSDVKPKPIVSRVEQNIELSQQTLSAETSGKKSLGVEWKGTLTAPSTSYYLIGLRADGFGRVSVDGKMVALQYSSQGVEAHLGRVHLVKGEKAVLEVQCRGLADLSMVTEARQPIIPGGDFTISIGSG